MRAPLAVYAVERLSGDERPRRDQVAVEEPLEIRVQPGPNEPAVSIAVTMRTPGHEKELAAGLLFSEGVVSTAAQIASLTTEGDSSEESEVVTVELAEGVEFDSSRLSRHLFTGSSCGVCGRAALDLLWQSGVRPFRPAFRPPAAQLATLPEAMRRHQSLFEVTGGVHAAALFSSSGQLLELREDIGRHNAVDKLVGSFLVQDIDLPQQCILAVSGRASYELVQKALMAAIPCLAAVGAPSSLAVDLAVEFRLTLAGFVSANSVNIYGAPAEE